MFLPIQDSLSEPIRTLIFDKFDVGGTFSIGWLSDGLNGTFFVSGVDMKLSSQLLEVRELKLEVLLVRDGPQAGTLAFDALGNASLNGFGLVTFDGSLGLRGTNANEALSYTYLIDEDERTFEFSADEGNEYIFSGSGNLTVNNQFEIQAEFAFRNTNFGNDPGFELVASDAIATMTTTGGSVSVENGALFAQFYSDGTMALDVQGSLSLSIADFASAEADARLQFNDSSRVINETVNIRGVSGELNVLSGTTASPYSKS